MTDKKETRWDSMDHNQCVDYLHKTINVSIQFSIRLLGEYLRNLKKLDPEKDSEKIEFIFEAVKNRLDKMSMQSYRALEFMQADYQPTKKASFLMDNTDGKLEPGVE